MRKTMKESILTDAMYEDVPTRVIGGVAYKGDPPKWKEVQMDDGTVQNVQITKGIPFVKVEEE